MKIRFFIDPETGEPISAIMALLRPKHKMFLRILAKIALDLKDQESQLAKPQKDGTCG
jgi:hypothetical protein